MKTSGTFELTIDMEKALSRLSDLVFPDSLDALAKLPPYNMPSFSEAKTGAAVFFAIAPNAEAVVVHSLRGCGDITQNPFLATTQFNSDGTWIELERRAIEII